MTLRALRENFSLTAQEVATANGIHMQTLLKYENDSSRIPMDLLNRLADYYNVSNNDIFLGKKYELKRTIFNNTPATSG